MVYMYRYIYTSLRVFLSCYFALPVSYAEELYTAYSQELSLKQSILGDILQQSNRDTLTVYLSCWLHQPFVDSNAEDKLEALVIEARLRS